MRRTSSMQRFVGSILFVLLTAIACSQGREATQQSSAEGLGSQVEKIAKVDAELSIAAKNGDDLFAFRRMIAAGVVESAAGKAASSLDHTLLQSIVAMNGVPREQIRSTLVALLRPNNTECGGASCARVLGLRSEQVDGYLDSLAKLTAISPDLKGPKLNQTRSVLLSSLTGGFKVQASRLGFQSERELAVFRRNYADFMEKIPYGFDYIGERATGDERFAYTEYVKFAQNFGKKIVDKYPDSVVFMQGSAATGVKFTTQAPFDAGRLSDFDIAICSPTLLQEVKKAGLDTRGAGGTRSAPLSLKHRYDIAKLRKIGLFYILKDAQNMTSRHRPVNIMVFDYPKTAITKTFSVLLPVN